MYVRWTRGYVDAWRERKAFTYLQTQLGDVPNLYASAHVYPVDVHRVQLLEEVAGILDEQFLQRPICTHHVVYIYDVRGPD